MELKKYQLRVGGEVKAYPTELAKQQAAGDKNAALDAWLDLRIPGPQYRYRRNAIGKDVPNFCLKVPTGARGGG